MQTLIIWLGLEDGGETTSVDYGFNVRTWCDCIEFLVDSGEYDPVLMRPSSPEKVVGRYPREF